VQLAIKAHALADFLAENASTPPEIATPSPFWNLYVDGSSIKDDNEVVLIIETAQGERQEPTLKFMFKASNNEAE